MTGPGILWLLQTAAGFSMAGPMFVVGVGFLRDGRLVGGLGFLALGAIALSFPTYLLNRIGGPKTWLRRVVGRVRRDTTDNGAETDSVSERASKDSSLLERLQR
ncbi:hypothetical protein [Natrinema versiforme]|uniref:Uncharacterized protein n=1 Tax=Natrinema versiforme JCM 10478 TaxID=1227496 RepID=L9Y3S6_9EURY|nr:hypothetical protein [Natrinema versiforme]ELY68705.1 hypothetical protein C489_06378 [Natrinema versiforme JCM 10478]